ncbi:nucleolar protein 6-like, partial [Ostrinia furnacalis]|uniref:nucleolar protein 6-like n=1 Tax=Ostrinia furnacalis TaxID=93504 RepID=UPI00103FA962
MVKRVAKNSVSEDDVDSQVLNENGKRAANVPNKEPKKRLKTKSLYRQPTANELNRLQETENLFNSNLFRLQVEEILQEVKVKEKTEKKFQEWYTEFKNHLLAIPENDTEYDLTESALAKTLKVKIPIGNKLSKTKCMFRFYKFSDVKIVGSYAIGCAINSKLCVNVQITVPADTYTKNDSINYRYHKKRAAYLAFIASHIKKHESVEEVKYTCLNGSEIKPVLDVTPSGKLNKYLTVRIDLACEAEAYKLHRFSPARNNLRKAWLFSEEGSDNNEIGPPTPYYNSSVLQDLTSSVNEEFLKESLLDRENLKQAVVLLKIWLRQRNLQVSGHVISLLVSYLVQIKRINNIMSSYQIVRNVWIALKSSEWDAKGISLHKGEDTPSLEEFHQHFPVVFIDKTGYYNICWQMCKGTYNALRRESELAVEILDNGKINSFLPLFMTPVKPLLQFDHILLFKDFQKLKESVLSKLPRPVRLNYGVEELALVTDSLHALLAKGLGQRVKLILQMVEADFSWSVKTKLDKAREESYKEQLSFGLILDPENCLNIVEKGPPANLPEAEVFRAFWGAKSELRRFQDGSITEACVWDADSLAERRAVTAQIVDYLLNIKFDIKPSDLFHVGSALESLVSRKQYNAQTEEASVGVVQALDELRRDLRQLQQLPLDVSAVYGVSPVFSYCEPTPALPRAPLNKPWRRGNAALVKEIVRDDGTWVVPEYTPVCKAVIEL